MALDAFETLPNFQVDFSSVLSSTAFQQYVCFPPLFVATFKMKRQNSLGEMFYPIHPLSSNQHEYFRDNAVKQETQYACLYSFEVSMCLEHADCISLSPHEHFAEVFRRCLSNKGKDRCLFLFFF